jgi:starch synthase (maltosyl-transferring)
MTEGGVPRIYYLHPLLAGALDQWEAHLERAAALGFDTVLTAPLFAADDLFLPKDFGRLHASLGWPGDAASGLGHIAGRCAAHNLALVIDIVLDRVGSAAVAPELFSPPDPDAALDPRRTTGHGAIARPDAAEALVAFWASLLGAWRAAGLGGVRLLSLAGLPAGALGALIGAVRQGGEFRFLGWTPDLPAPVLTSLAGCGLDYVFSSLPYWDFRSDWLWAQAAELGRIGRVIACCEAPFGARIAGRVADAALRPVTCRRAARFAAAFGDGWLMPMGFEFTATEPMDARRDRPADLPPAPPFELAADIRAANATMAEGTPRLLSGPGADAIVFRRGQHLVFANAALNRPTRLGWGGVARTLAPGEVRVEPAPAEGPIVLPRPALIDVATGATRAPRIVIEAVTPTVEDGRFAAKRTVGEVVIVEADIVCEGHDQLGVALLWRAADETGWRQRRMAPLGNDRWQAGFPLERIGRYLFTIEAWHDAFATWCDEVRKKHAAGLDVRLELLEGRVLVEAAGPRAAELSDVLGRLKGADQATQVGVLLGEDTAALMAAADERRGAVRLLRDRLIDADREAARFASWYEVFPRSLADDERRHGTFDDVIRHLPRIRGMGFDVLYFPPIHPIGRVGRKGRNNSLPAGPSDPGSPYAIGSAEGGHDAIHPELGSFEDFHRLLHALSAHGLELALDFAVQCAPDHPWLTQHPEWFSWRPDGSLKYAENPPKKYEDIVNVEFYAAAAMPALWVALTEVVLFWCGHGVRIFRVDNPHTKPLPFWEFLIAEVRARHPDAIFLAEAFTRPKLMKALAKLGFTQSYTYFTWRHTARELTDYLTELTTEAAEYFRPNFFVNTPDINPAFLQGAGRPGFLIRAALATTLSGLWGAYNGFELCEATPLPGREEYLDSEKYQLRTWDWDRPGNIVAEIAALNEIRRLNPALQTHLGVSFLPTGNDHLLAYEKATADRSNVVVVAVSLNAALPQEGTIDLPLWRWGLPDGGTLPYEDLLSGGRGAWVGRRQRLALTPSQPYALWRALPAGGPA